MSGIFGHTLYFLTYPKDGFKNDVWHLLYLPCYTAQTCGPLLTLTVNNFKNRPQSSL